MSVDPNTRDLHSGVDPSIHPSLHPSRPSFREAIGRARRQICAFAFEGTDGEIADEICKIIAEIYMMPEGERIRISGEWLDKYIVAQVFAELTDNHVREVISAYQRIGGEIKNTKAYLRTMLYNAVFSSKAKTALNVKQDLGIW